MGVTFRKPVDGGIELRLRRGERHAVPQVGPSIAQREEFGAEQLERCAPDDHRLETQTKQLQVRVEPLQRLPRSHRYHYI